MQDRVTKSNANFDALFTREKEQFGIDAHKYDVVIPVTDTRMAHRLQNYDLMEKSIFTEHQFQQSLTHLDNPSLHEKNIYLYQ